MVVGVIRDDATILEAMGRLRVMLGNPQRFSTDERDALRLVLWELEVLLSQRGGMYA